MKMEQSPRKISTVMGIPSVVDNLQEVVTQKMDILMILNPLDADIKSEEHSDNETVDSKMDLDIPQQLPNQIQVSSEHFSESLFQYQARIDGTEAHARRRDSQSARTQLPPAPTPRCSLTFNPINAPSSQLDPYPLPPIYTLHDDRYHSQSSPTQIQLLPPRRHSQPNPIANNRRPRSNKAYMTEEVDFIRYQKEDCSKHWPEVLSCFKKYFRGRESEQCLSSRYYRDNNIKMYDKSGRIVRDENGRARKISAKVRRRGTPVGRLEALPSTLVQKHPERAMKYPWVSEIHRAEMRKLAAEMSDLERGTCLSSPYPIITREYTIRQTANNYSRKDELTESATVEEG